MSENKNKFVNWLKTKRYYIVLALCILTVTGTYMLLSRSTAPQTQTPPSDAQISEAPENEPLPDLADYFPPELEPEAIEENRREQGTQNALPQPDTAENALQASAGAENVEKEPLVYIFPVEGSVQKAYSGDTLVYSKTMSDWRAHSGIDIRAEAGSEVSACAGGVIEDVYTDERMGITIVIDHQNGYKSIYANLSNGMLVEAGQSVSAGEVISTVGTSALFEAADESHLHFEMTKNGEHIDPATVLE